MREISLHILDILQNSLEAGASRVELMVEEDSGKDLLTVTVADNGKGMQKAFAEAAVNDAFVTSRRTRRVGLGLPLLKASAERSNGTLTIDSAPGKGTRLTATFRLSNIDRPPLGNMSDTLLSVIVGRPETDIRYVRRVDDQEFELDTAEARQVLGDVPFNRPEVISWLRDYLAGAPKGTA